MQLHLLAVKCVSSVLKSQMLGCPLINFVRVNCPKFVGHLKGCAEMAWPQACTLVTDCLLARSACWFVCVCPVCLPSRRSQENRNN